MPSRRGVLASVAATGCVLAGCAGRSTRSVAYRSYGYDTHNRGAAPTTGVAGPVTVAWRVDEAVGGQVPAVVDGQVFVAVETADGAAVRAVDDVTGERQWTYADVGPLGTWRPAVAGDRLCFLDRDGVAHAVDIADGTRVWRRALPDSRGLGMSPVAVDDALVVGVGDITRLQFNGLYALELADGTTRWHREPGATGGTETPAYPAAADGRIFYAAPPYDGEAGAVTAVTTTDGTVERSQTVGAATSGPVRSYTGVAVTDGRVYTGGPRGIAAVEREDWTLAWRATAGGSFAPPTVADEQVYAVAPVDETGRFGVVAFNNSGQRRWTHVANRPDDATVGAGSPAVVGETLYYGARDGRLYALDTATGDHRWRVGEPASRPVGPPAVVDGTVYAVSSRGLVALRPQ